jgi:hypothetical protein
MSQIYHESGVADYDMALDRFEIERSFEVDNSEKHEMIMKYIQGVLGPY